MDGISPTLRAEKNDAAILVEYDTEENPTAGRLQPNDK